MSEVNWITDEADLYAIIAHNPTVVIDFTAPSWCVPCQRFAPHFDKAASSTDDVTFVAVDIDKAPWAVVRFGVQGVPTVMLYRNGEYVKNLQERTVIKLLAEISDPIPT